VYKLGCVSCVTALAIQVTQAMQVTELPIQVSATTIQPKNMSYMLTRLRQTDHSANQVTPKNIQHKSPHISSIHQKNNNLDWISSDQIHSAKKNIQHRSAPFNTKQFHSAQITLNQVCNMFIHHITHSTLHRPQYVQHLIIQHRPHNSYLIIQHKPHNTVIQAHSTSLIHRQQPSVLCLTSMPR
jgi:hypothetical protein